MSDDHIQSVDKKFVTDGSSQFRKLHVNFHKFHALFSTRSSQFGKAVTSFAQFEFQKCLWVHTKHKEWLQL
jgi:hypothetical protein